MSGSVKHQAKPKCQASSGIARGGKHATCDNFLCSFKAGFDLHAATAEVWEQLDAAIAEARANGAFHFDTAPPEDTDG
jgi:hypothetical protein